MADNQDPLDALQKLLADQKQAAAANDQAPQAEVKTEAIEAEHGPTAEEIALLQQQKEAEDQQKIQEQLQVMATELQATPQYQARLSQKQASEAELAKKRLEERSKRIFQLKHLEKV
jgi:hypothetical protein